MDALDASLASFPFSPPPTLLSLDDYAGAGEMGDVPPPARWDSLPPSLAEWSDDLSEGGHSDGHSDHSDVHSLTTRAHSPAPAGLFSLPSEAALVPPLCLPAEGEWQEAVKDEVVEAASKAAGAAASAAAAAEAAKADAPAPHHPVPITSSGRGKKPAAGGGGSKSSAQSSTVCYVCGKVFSCSWSRNRHLNVHLDVRRYPCTYDGCEWVFRERHTLERHVAACHLKKRPFACEHPGCEYRSSGSSNLRRHLRTCAYRPDAPPGAATSKRRGRS